MQVIRFDSPNFQEELSPLLKRSSFNPDIDKSVAAIIADVKARGDAALCDYAQRFDHATLTPAQFEVTEAEFAEAEALVPENVKTAIRTAYQHIVAFSSQRIPQEWSFSPRVGVTLGEKFTPIDRVGCYIPGGTAPLISTVVHTVGIASTAGVKEILVVTPPGKDGGKVNPALLFACKTAGATKVYRLGGVYGVAALAFGTETVPKVEKIVGPGNAYVTAAKRQLYGEVALDLVAGPSEIMVVADKTANPAFIAADLLSQAEHGSGFEQAVMVTTEPSLIDAVQAELAAQSAQLSRLECVRKVLANGVFLILAKDIDQATDLAGKYAPEHLEMMTANPRENAAKVRAAGAIFLGPWTPEPVGDFVAGPSHVLPTGGAARYFSGLTVEMFFRRTSLVEYSQEALMADLPHIECFAKCEGLDGHGRSATIRRG